MMPTHNLAKRRDIQFHYDVGDDFYRLWLDPEMNYSAALWDRVDDLESAQEQKNAFHIEVVNARAARRILDVGCGWGALLRAVHALSPDAELVGLTLSSKQREHCAKTLPDGQILLESWEDHSPSSPYDAIVCIGALEHFANHRMTKEERIRTYLWVLKRYGPLFPRSIPPSGRPPRVTGSVCGRPLVLSSDGALG